MAGGSRWRTPAMTPLSESDTLHIDGNLVNGEAVGDGRQKKKNIFGRNVVTLWNDEMVQVTDYTFFSKIVNRMQMRLSIR